MLAQQNKQGYFRQRNITEYKETQRIVKKQITHNQHKQTIRKHERQSISASPLSDEYRGHVSRTELPERAVAEMIDEFQAVKLNYENSYILQPPISFSNLSRKTVQENRFMYRLYHSKERMLGQSTSVCTVKIDKQIGKGYYLSLIPLQ